MFQQAFGAELAKVIWEKLDADTQKKINEALGEKILIVDDGQLIPKHRFDEVNGKLKEATEREVEAKKLVESQQKQFDELKKAAAGNEALQKQIEDMKVAQANQQKEYDERVKSMTIDTQVKEALGKVTKYASLLAKEIDRTKLELTSDGKIKGLDDQIKVLAEKDDFKELFMTTEFSGKTPLGGNSSPAASEAQKKYEQACKDFGPASQEAIAAKLERDQTKPK
jgi:hypothetical protein